MIDDAAIDAVRVAVAISLTVTVAVAFAVAIASLKLLPNCCTVYEKHINFASALCCCCVAAVTPSTWLLSGTQIAVGAGVGTVGHKQISINILMRIKGKYLADIG